MNDLIKFIDRYSFEDTLYWRAPVLGGDVEYEIWWTKSGWSLRRSGTTALEHCKSDSLVPFLTDAGIDLRALESQLRDTVIHFGLYAEMVGFMIAALVGVEVMAQAKVQQQIFAKQLIGAVNAALNPDTSQPLRLV